MSDKDSKQRTAAKQRNDESEFSIDLLGVLNRRKGLILASAFIGLLVGGSYFLFMPPKYESRAQILLMQNDSASMASNMDSGQNSISEDLLATHMSMLQSSRIVADALTIEPGAGNDLEDLEAEVSSDFVESSEDIEAVTKQEGLTTTTFPAELHNLGQLESIVSRLGEDETPVDYVIDNLYVTRGGDGAARDARVLSLAFRHPDPVDSQKVVEAILAMYKEFVKDKFQDVNEEAVGLIGKAREELTSKIEQLNEEYQEFRENAPVLASTEGGANVYAIRYEELSADLSDLLVQIDEASGRLTLVKQQLERLKDSDGHELEKLALIDEKNAERLGILVTVERGEAQTAAFQALMPERMAGAQTEYSSLLALKGQLRQALSDFGAKHPEVVTLQTQIKEMEEFFLKRSAVLGNVEEEAPLTPDDVMNAYVNLLENDLLALQQRKTDLEKQINESEEKARELVSTEIENENLLREISRQEDLFSSVVERLRDINMQSDSSALIQEVIEEPRLGEQVSPNAPIAAAITMLATMLLAGSTILLAELSDKSIHSAEDLEEIYDAPILSHVPDFERDAETRLLMRKVAKIKPQFAPALIAYHDPKSRISEIYRTVRTQLLFNLGKDKKVVAVTSPTQSDGKSTNIANLAVSLAKTGKSVLLIDADMRRPTLHTIFGLQASPGLSDVLEHEVELSDGLHAELAENLSVITCGEIPENPAELLSQDSFGEFVSHVREKFDYVLIDCPPVLPVSDPCIAAKHVDAMLLVTSLDGEGVPKARYCQKSLAASGAAIGGLIVNRAGKTNGYYAYPGYEVSYSQQYA